MEGRKANEMQERGAEETWISATGSVAQLEIVNCTFDHAILKTNHKTTNPLRYINCLVNKDPRFEDPSKLDYRIDSISPAIGAGKVIGGIPFDILGHERGTTPALGAYEYVKIR